MPYRYWGRATFRTPAYRAKVDYGRRAGRTENMIGLALNAGMLAETGIGTLRTSPARLTMSGPEGKADLVAALLDVCPIYPAEIRTCDMLWSSRCCLGRRFLLRRSQSIVTSGSRRLEKRANPASLNFGRNSGKTRATITHTV